MLAILLIGLGGGAFYPLLSLDRDPTRNIHLKASLGDVGAQEKLGEMYLNGHGEPQDRHQELKWFRSGWHPSLAPRSESGSNSKSFGLPAFALRAKSPCACHAEASARRRELRLGRPAPERRKSLFVGK